MHTYKLNKILDFKVMGLNGNDQTACLCLARDTHYAAEGHSRNQRHLTIKTAKAKNSE